MSTATDRRVRVTVEGTARPVKHDSRYLFVKHGGHSFLVNADAEGVVVEDIVPPRVWSDGDVLATCANVYERRGGLWRVTGSDRTFTDDHANDMAECDSNRVLRYQVGEQ